MNSKTLAIKKYLSNYAEKEARQIASLPYHYQNVLVIPVYDEPLSFWEEIKLSPALKDVKELLLIFIINCPETNKENYNNRILVSNILKETELLATYSNQRLLRLDGKQHILLVDRYSQGFEVPEKQGVGLARKIGCDIALHLINEGNIHSSWIHSSDADTRLPAGYFKACNEECKPGALLYPFIHTHHSDSSRLYDFSLSYYVSGLAWAGSPYAFHTLGSIIACHYQSYAEVRGYPKRAAGEDFYLLNKIAKVGHIRSLNTPTIKIQARISDRVPFGTGPAISKIDNLENPLKDYLFYHPLSFYYLKIWLKSINYLWQFKELTNDQALLKSIKTAIILNGEDESNICLFELTTLINCLQELNINKQVRHGFEQCKTENHFIRHMHHAFDGFQTLKFIHYLRENKLESIPLCKLDLHSESTALSSLKNISRLKQELNCLP